MFTNDNKAVIKERVDFVLERGLKTPHETTSQNVAIIARAIVNRPKYLFCDEPNPD
jgi:phospholipid/cholesterol/gamma-HCH transport system ATP-binding protein